MTNKRKPGQSQLDYLWTNFGSLEVSNKSNENPSNETLLTEVAIINLLKNNLAKIDAVLDAKIDGNVVTLLIKDQQGTILSQIEMDLSLGFERYVSTEEDVNNGLISKSGLTCLKLTTATGQEFLIELMSGSETDTIITTVRDNKISAKLKIDNPVTDKSVEIKQFSTGIQANLLVNNKSSVKVDKTEDGILVHQTWEDESIDLKTKALTTNQYLMITEIDDGTIYFLTDRPYIFFRNVRYCADITDEQLEALLNNKRLSLEDTNKIIEQIFK